MASVAGEVELSVEYEVTVRVLGARLPEALDSYCTMSLIYPSVAAGGNFEHVTKTTDVCPISDSPSWAGSPSAQFIHVSELPHSSLEVTLWGKKNGRDEPFGSYKVSLKPAHFDESKALIADSLVMEGTPYNIEHPDDVAVRKALDLNPRDEAALRHVPVKVLPSLQLQFFCRHVPLPGQCDHCRAVMRDPAADLDLGLGAKATHEDVDRRRPFTLPCRHTVCGEHLFGTGVCPVCQVKVYTIDSYFNYLVDKYLEFRLMENSKICAECGGPRARIYCPECEYFFCAKCDTSIHDRNLFFRAHVRQDARKPFKVLRHRVHDCDVHRQPFVKYDTTAAVPTDKPLCATCVTEKENELLQKLAANENSVKDYAGYRKELMDKIRVQVEGLSKVTDKQLALYQATVLRTETDIEARAQDISERVEQYRTELPKALRARELQLHADLDDLVARHNVILEKQAQLWVAVVLGLQNQERMTSYVVGPVVTQADRANGVIDRASKVELMQLYLIRQGLTAMFNQKFLHQPYVSGDMTLTLDPEANKKIATLGNFSDMPENDGFRGDTSIIKCNPRVEKFAQLSRSIMAGDLPYFFAIRTAASDRSDGKCAQVAAIGVTRYGPTPEKPLFDRSQLPHVWAFGSRAEVSAQTRLTWKFFHGPGYIDVAFKEVPLVPRYLGYPQMSEFKDDRQPNTTYDLLGCLVDRHRGVIELFKYLPHVDSQDNSFGTYFESTTICPIECFEHVYPTVSLLEGSEEGSVEIAVSRFVADRAQAVDLFREQFA